MFDKAICINLDHRMDRWQICQEEFYRFGIKVERFSARAHENPMTGIHMSYHSIFRENKGNSLLILEDDVQFTHTQDDFVTCCKELPSDWHMLYLGGNALRKQYRYSQHLFKADGIVTTHAIMYSAEMVSWLADNLFEAHDKIDRSNTIDVWFMDNVQPNFNCFICNPQIAAQRFGYSDICKMNINYNHFNSIARKYYL